MITIGCIVRFKIPSPHGPMIVAGTVKRVIREHQVREIANSVLVEVKSQNHGYFIVNTNDIL